MSNVAYESASARVRYNVPDEERERAMNEAKAFAPTNPYCRVSLRASYLYRGCIMVRYSLQFFDIFLWSSLTCVAY